MIATETPSGVPNHIQGLAIGIDVGDQDYADTSTTGAAATDSWSGWGERAVLRRGSRSASTRPERTGHSGELDMTSSAPPVVDFSQLRWGTHLCHFYATSQDLLDTLAAFFKAGLEKHEYCLWILSATMTADQAAAALRSRIPDADRRLSEGLEIHPSPEWYLKDGTFDGARVIQSWQDKLDGALARGYAGMRINGTEDWFSDDLWPEFATYERSLDAWIRGRPMIALCSYPLREGAIQILDVARAHQFALAKRRGQWEILETPEFRAAERLKSETAAREEERTRIARELHDEMGSTLTRVRWDLHALDKALTESSPQTPPAVHERLSETARLVDSTIESVRRIAAQLRPTILDDLGLIAALESQVQQFTRATGITCRLHVLLDDEGQDLAGEQATALFRIVQEALTNVSRHARATLVNIVLERRDEDVVLEVRDNGVGIDAEELAKPDALGLLGMRERAALVNGWVGISGRPGKGTVLIVRIPRTSPSAATSRPLT
jgi:signal transduction histidine kinase